MKKEFYWILSSIFILLLLIFPYTSPRAEGLKPLNRDTRDLTISFRIDNVAIKCSTHHKYLCLHDICLPPISDPELFEKTASCKITNYEDLSTQEQEDADWLLTSGILPYAAREKYHRQSVDAQTQKSMIVPATGAEIFTFKWGQTVKKGVKTGVLLSDEKGCQYGGSLSWDSATLKALVTQRYCDDQRTSIFPPRQGELYIYGNADEIHLKQGQNIYLQ
jgi:hypothetical protein